jgi:DNA-binding GntR family transcriptional regulator
MAIMIELPLPKFIPQNPTSLSGQLTDFLKNLIIEGHLPGGYHLVESELHRHFGISRAPIREAFRALEAEGLLVSIPRKGTFVRRITRKDVQEHFPIRALLEGFAARLACAHAREDDVQAMEVHFEQMRKAVEEQRYKDYLTHHSEYHCVLVRASKNDALIEILNSLRRQTMWIIYLYRYVVESYEHELQIHRRIIDLLIARNAAAVESLVKEHIESALESFLRFVDVESLDIDSDSVTLMNFSNPSAALTSR